jgi:hypothetical protein
MESESARDRREVVARMLNWRKFDSYLENFKEMMSADGRYRQAWKDVESPFGTQESA